MPDVPLACGSTTSAAEIVSTPLDVVTRGRQPCTTTAKHGVEMQLAGGSGLPDSQEHISAMMDGIGNCGSTAFATSVHHH